MFDPTVFENLKVAFENQLYDLDNLDREIDIVNRVDRLELAVMAREFRLRFTLAERHDISAEILLSASLKELAAEILELKDEIPSCGLRIRFYLQLENADNVCSRIEDLLQRIWGTVSPPAQTISYRYGAEKPIYSNTAEITFPRKINEEQMDDIPELIRHTLQTLHELHEAVN
ncbi:hypothetical protein KP806_06615 [Paenibacillus sp. N4]|uniref:hypothetical protein n=1 Tax=Paenibacillus vietnamensis TaxID=2590547 RepID=UPI001CD09B63|nr:hypothetical protein [Paenibacillus vietnamensis]MCA0754718.1 hypothetical protein [Paenibacillus vietnamensis]